MTCSLETNSKRPTILIADDDADVRAWLRKILLPLGVLVEEATDGGDLLARIADARADAVITDDHMPLPHGHQVVGMARACGIDIPFLVISAHETDQAGSDRLGATSYLSKPLSPHALRAWCRQCLPLRDERTRGEKETR